MTAISVATQFDVQDIAAIGRSAVEEVHRESCSAADMQIFLDANYNDQAIANELADPTFQYFVVTIDKKIVGFSKIILNCAHEKLESANYAKLDRIYLRSEYYDRKLGYALLNFNIDFAKENKQRGLWLFTWVGNTRALSFYTKTGFAVHAPHRFKVTESHYNEHYQMVLHF